MQGRGVRPRSGVDRSPILVFMALLAALGGCCPAPRAPLAYALLAFLGSVGLWWLTAWLLLEGQVRWRVLLFSGALTGTAMSVFAATAFLWMPDVVTKDQAQFGFFGIALALVTWFSLASTIIMVGVCAGAVAAEDPGVIGNWVRGSGGSNSHSGGVGIASGADPNHAPFRRDRHRGRGGNAVPGRTLSVATVGRGVPGPARG